MKTSWIFMGLMWIALGFLWFFQLKSYDLIGTDDFYNNSFLFYSSVGIWIGMIIAYIITLINELLSKK